MRYFLLLLTLTLLVACSPNLDDLHAYTQSVNQNMTVQIEPYPEFHAPPVFTYSAQTLRNPFTHENNSTVRVVQTRQKNCLQPDFQRPKEPLEAYGLDALSMAGSFTSQGVKWALINSNDGILYKASIGSHIGLFYGRITHISSNSISIEQLLPDGAGCWQKKETTLSRASASGEHNNG